MTTLRVCALLLALAPLAVGAAVAAPDRETGFRARRIALVRDIEANGVRDSATLDAMRRVPRHEFVLPHDRDQAYGDHPLPIGHGQTISQPYVVAYMTEVLRPRPGLKVLEVGTGSGYQAAVLAQIGCAVRTTPAHQGGGGISIGFDRSNAMRKRRSVPSRLRA
jgi:protein-L-isoaspartate(D-aspartate) O-methyltransferase